MQSRRLLTIMMLAALSLLRPLAGSAAPHPAPGAASADDGAEPSAPVSFDKFTKGADKQTGLFTVYVKDGKVFLELQPDQFGRDYLEHATTVNGLGGYGVLSGDDFEQEARLLHFVRADARHVALVWPPVRFLAPADTPFAAAVRGSTADSIQGVAPVVAEDKDSKAVIVDLSLLLGDTLDLGNSLSDAVKDPENPQGGYRIDTQRSYFGPAKALPQNIVIEADQTFASEKPDTVNTVVDPRSIQLRVKYNFAAILSSPDYVPRLADDRVGFWSDPHLRFDNDAREDNRVHYILRWNMKASNPAQPLSPAVKPIVYTISNTVPDEYRAPIRAAILEWNKAFEKIGISDAVKVQDQPADPNFDPDDIRYNVVRWLTEANGGGFAEAQIEWDPRTGEIFRGGVLIDADLARYGKFLYTDIGAPDQPGAAQLDLWNPAAVDAPAYGRASRIPHGLVHRDDAQRGQAQFGALALMATDGSVPANYTYDYMKSIVLHEVGHDFGLAHNFIGHNAYTAAEVKDKSFTGRFGVASSVMEYAPVNVWPKGSSRGELFQSTIGPYDYHAIHWGYAPVPGARTSEDEVPTLDAWAESAAFAKYAFASDEDVAYDGHAVDPRVAQWQLTDHPIQWCETQLGFDRDLMRSLDARFPSAEQPWEQERFAFAVLVRQYNRCAGAMTHYIAGEYLTRSRRGDPGAPVPLSAVPRAVEAQAYRDLDRYLFAESAWQISPATLNRLVYTEYGEFGNFGYAPAPRHDLSLAAVIGAYQDHALAYMFSPLVLARLADLPAKTSPGATMSLADLFDWTRASIFGDATGAPLPRSQLRRNLQRNYARLLARIAVAPYAGTPYDAQAFARRELRSLSASVRAIERRTVLDALTRAHFEALENDVTRALDAKSLAPLN